MFDSQEEIESILIKAITYSDENLLKQTLKIYKSQEIKLNDAHILHHAVKLAKVKVNFIKNAPFWPKNGLRPVIRQILERANRTKIKPAQPIQ